MEIHMIETINNKCCKNDRIPLEADIFNKDKDLKFAKSVYNVVARFNDELCESKEKQIEFCCNCYCDNFDSTELDDAFPKTQFSSVGGNRAHVLNGLKRELLSVDPIDALCGIALGKKSVYFRNDDAGKVLGKHTTETIRNNDIAVEVALVIPVLTEALMTAGLGEECTVFFPSPFFIRKWARLSDMKGRKTTFVVEDLYTKRLLDMQFKVIDYCGVVRDDLEFLTYEEYEQNSMRGTALFMLGDTTQSNVEKMMSILWTAEYTALYIFGDDRDIYNCSRDKIISQGIKEIFLLPRNIKSGMNPGYRGLCRISFEHKMGAKKNVLICLGNIYKKENKEWIDPKKNKVVEVPLDSFDNEATSLRHLYSKFTRESVTNKRRMPESIRFSREIYIWYTITKENKEKGKSRIEAYICGFPNRKRMRAHLLERGKRIQGSVRQKSNIEMVDAEKWLTTEYPFIFPYRNAGTKGVRENVGEYYREHFDKMMDISIKTLWYIYPEIEANLSENEAKLLIEMVMYSDLGDLQVRSSKDQNYMNLISEMYSDESTEKQFKRLHIISEILDFVEEKGYCSENVLNETISENSLSDKAFSQFRSALSKKTLTIKEEKNLYKILLENVDGENGAFYLGILIRLFTGLESNIVCALKWKDFVRVEEYNFYQLVIYCQVTNDGSEMKKLKAKEDYRCIPCPAILADALIKEKRMLEEKYPESAYNEMNIVRDNDNQPDGISMAIPIELDKLGKKMIEELGIRDVMITIPDNIKGTKENNLSRYYGDFFRSNFRFWALKIAKFTPDELQYVIGNKGATTFGRYYCDYVNPSAQKMIYTKSQRIGAVLQDHSFTSDVIDFDINNDSLERNYIGGESPVAVDLLLQKPAGSEVRVQISCNYGAAVSIAAWQTMEEKKK